jgi:hypothetical protein
MYDVLHRQRRLEMAPSGLDALESGAQSFGNEGTKDRPLRFRAKVKPGTPP